MSDERDKKVLVALGESISRSGPTTVIFGIPDEAWKVLLEGNATHTFDLTKVGIRLQAVMFRGETYADCVRIIQEGAAFLSTGTPDRDLGIDKPTVQ